MHFWQVRCSEMVRFLLNQSCTGKFKGKLTKPFFFIIDHTINLSDKHQFQGDFPWLLPFRYSEPTAGRISAISIVALLAVRLALLVSVDSLKSLLPLANAPPGHRFFRSPPGSPTENAPLVGAFFGGLGREVPQPLWVEYPQSQSSHCSPKGSHCSFRLTRLERA